MTVDQARILTFADATDDWQWIHVDADRASAGPYGTTIAHGFLTLSLAPRFVPELLVVDGVSMVVNYGLERVRFPSPVPVGARIRGVGKLSGAVEVRGCVQATVALTVEIDGSSKPACVAELVFRYYES
jgi:acyl dehydratase